MTTYKKKQIFGGIGVVGDPISVKTCQTTENEILKKCFFGAGKFVWGRGTPFWGEPVKILKFKFKKKKIFFWGGGQKFFGGRGPPFRGEHVKLLKIKF